MILEERSVQFQHLELPAGPCRKSKLKTSPSLTCAKRYASSSFPWELLFQFFWGQPILFHLSPPPSLPLSSQFPAFTEKLYRSITAVGMLKVCADLAGTHSSGSMLSSLSAGPVWKTALIVSLFFNTFSPEMRAPKTESLAASFAGPSRIKVNACG